MPKPRPLKRVLKILEARGFFFVSQHGSHVKYRSRGNPIRTVIIPMHGKEIPHGTFRSILRQANLTQEDFET
jgi:predicted RNA binding protein YcfA (HicA-like mRNA interferase family)